MDRSIKNIVHIGYKPRLLDSGLSVWLDHFRWMAALTVVMDHVRWVLFPNFEAEGLHPHLSLIQKAFFFFARFGNQAVVLFFVISGLLVGGSIFRKVEAGRFVAWFYALDRLSRLGVVLIPALIWSVGLQRIGYSMACQGPDNWLVILGNLALVQNLGIVEPICNNHPLWSLSSEAWFYVVGPALLLVFIGPRRGGAAIVLTLALILGVLRMKFDQYTPIFGLVLWLAGLLPWFVTLRLPPWMPALVLVAVLALSRTSFLGTTAVKDLLIMASFTAMLCTDPARWTRPARRFAHGFAAFSYSLYLVHMPAIQAIGAALGKALPVDRWTSYVAYVGCVGLMVLLGWAFGFLFESRTGSVRNWLYRRSSSPVREAA
jgi:peptidoglycan/LPS O-acetylase OafA/YrhL